MLASKVLNAALETHGWSRQELAKRTGIANPTVSQHLNDAQPIRDNHLAAYVEALDKYEQSILVAAWLRDTLPTASQDNVLDPQTTRLNEAVTTWTPELTPEQQDMLRFWANKISRDTELAEVFSIVTRRAGWQPQFNPVPTPGILPAHLRTLLATSQSALLLTGPDRHHILAATPAVKDVCGYTPAELIGQSIPQLLQSATTRASDKTAISTALAAGAEFHGPIENQH